MSRDTYSNCVAFGLIPLAVTIRQMVQTRPANASNVTTTSGTSSVTSTILQRIAQGEKAAVQECLSRYGGLVWTLARRFLGNATEAEDAVQEIFVELWKNAGKYNPALSSEPTYVTMVTRRRLIDRRRKIVRRPELSALPDSIASQNAPGTRQVELVDEAAIALKALQTLRPEQQQVLKLSVYRQCMGLDAQQPNALSDHHQCRLGHWYESGRGKHAFGHNPQYTKLEPPHATVHKEAKLAIGFCQEGLHQNMATALGRMEHASRELSRLINALGDETRAAFAKLAT